MAKITRKTQKVFAGSASNNGQFGSAQVGTKVTSTDPDVIQQLAAWASGWNSATISAQRLPTLEEMQGIQYVVTRQLAYILQEGIPEWDAGTSYYINSIVKKAGTYQIYGSVINDNLNNALPAAVTDANWQYLGDLSAQGNVVGQSSSVDSEIALFSGTTGKIIKRATGTGYVKVSSGVYQTPASTVPLTDLASQAANTVVANASGSSAAPTAFAVAASRIVGRGSSGNLAALTASNGLSIGASSIDTIAGELQAPINVPYTTYTNTAVALPFDNTIPQNTEGLEIFNQNFTPVSASGVITIEGQVTASASSDGLTPCLALFQDTTANAIAAFGSLNTNNSGITTFPFRYEVSSASTALRAYKGRIGTTSGTCYVNGSSVERKYGGVGVSSFRLSERRA